MRVAMKWDDEPMPTDATYSRAAKEPLEVLSRLAGGTTFRMPDMGRGCSALTDVDIAHALGCVSDPLKQCIACAAACQSASEWPKVQDLLHVEVLRRIGSGRWTRRLIAGPNRYRARLVAHVAFHDYVLLRAPALKKSAQATRMRTDEYSDLYWMVRGIIESLAQDGAAEACRLLFREASVK